LAGSDALHARLTASAVVLRVPPWSATPPLDDRGREILDLLEAVAPPPFKWSYETGARSFWVNAQGTPAGGYESALDEIAADWREHLS
jgi:hypothetical protein